MSQPASSETLATAVADDLCMSSDVEAQMVRSIVAGNGGVPASELEGPAANAGAAIRENFGNLFARVRRRYGWSGLVVKMPSQRMAIL